MNMNLVGIAGVPGVGCNCSAMGESAAVADPVLTEEQKNALRWATVGLLGAAVVGIYFMERHIWRSYR